MTGEVTPNREAILSVVVLGIDGSEHRVVAVLDTGFTAELTLPSNLVAALGLPFVTNERGILADGSVQRIRVYSADMLWDGEQRTIQVHVTEGGILLGMSLLLGFHLGIDVVDGGAVIITPIA